MTTAAAEVGGNRPFVYCRHPVDRGNRITGGVAVERMHEGRKPTASSLKWYVRLGPILLRIAPRGCRVCISVDQARSGAFAHLAVTVIVWRVDQRRRNVGYELNDIIFVPVGSRESRMNVCAW